MESSNARWIHSGTSLLLHDEKKKRILHEKWHKKIRGSDNYYKYYVYSRIILLWLTRILPTNIDRRAHYCRFGVRCWLWSYIFYLDMVRVYSMNNVMNDMCFCFNINKLLYKYSKNVLFIIVNLSFISCHTEDSLLFFSFCKESSAISFSIFKILRHEIWSMSIFC